MSNPTYGLGVWINTYLEPEATCSTRNDKIPVSLVEEKIYFLLKMLGVLIYGRYCNT